MVPRQFTIYIVCRRYLSVCYGYCSTQCPEKWPSANYGTGLDIVAPAWHMFTTNISTSGSCNAYTPDFGPDGTSFAAPLVSGTIALMAAINPDLTREQYEAILLSNTNKFGGYSYNVNNTYGTWSNEVGYGVLDVLACVTNLPTQHLCIDGRVTISGSHPDYSATSSITATCNSSTFTIANTGSVNFQSGGSVTLLPGFHAISGSTFQALIQPLDNVDNFRIANNQVTNNRTQLTETTDKKITDIPLKFSLFQNYPNPFNPTTVVNYALKENVNVKITVYDILGRVVKTLVNEYQDAGYKSVLWNGTNGSGSWFQPACIFIR